MLTKTLLATVLFSVSTLTSPITDLTSSNTEAQSNYFKLNTRKFTRSIFDQVYYDHVQRKFFKRDDDSEYVEMDLTHESTFYSTELEIGSPSQKVKVLVDTGSSDLWVVASNNSLCESGTSGSLNNKMRALDDVLGGNYTHTTSQGLFVQHKPVYTLPYGFTTVTVSFPDYGTDYQSDFTINPTTVSPSGYSTGTATSLPDVTSTSSSSSGSGSSSGSSSGSTIDCSIYGTFDPDSSDTFESNGTSFYITYADSTYARGTWGHDDVVIGDYNVTSLSFAVCDDTDNDLGVLGIGLSGLETTYTGSSDSSTTRYQYENLPLKLKSDGFINMVAYSIYLNSDSSDEDASVLFGAIDHNKYTGDLVALPIVNTLASYGYDDPIYTYITLNSINIVDTSSSTEATIGSGAAPALLDTGSTLSYAPSDVYSAIVSYLDAEYSSSVGGYIMKCSDADNYNIIFNFQGKEISVSFSSFMVSLTSSSGSTSSYCMVGILSNSGTTFTLGDNFIRNVYLIQDFENYEIILGDVNHGDDENIEILTSTIPSVASTASASAWSTSSQSLTVASTIETHAYSGSSTTRKSSSSSSSQARTTTTTSNTSDSESSSSSSSTTASVSSISSTGSNNAANGKLNDNNICGFAVSFLFFIVSLF